MGTVGLLSHQLKLLEAFEAIGQDVSGYFFGRLQKLFKSLLVEEKHVSYDQKCPAIANFIQRTGNWANRSSILIHIPFSDHNLNLFTCYSLLTCILQSTIIDLFSLAKCNTDDLMNKKALQIVLAILGLIPILTGGLDLILGARSLNFFGSLLPITALNDIVLDSQIRFLGAIWFGVGITWYWVISAIERQTTLFRLLIGGVFLGGIGRASSALLVGIPPIQFIAAIALELIGMPLLLLWQSSVSKSNRLTEPSTI
jgi:Domain of unknown function (DUF4345)